MRSRYALPVLVLVALVSVRPASAQAGSPDHVWSRGTTLDVFAGLGAASAGAGALAGGAVGWEITSRFGLDGTVLWFDAPGAREAFAAALTAHLSPGGDRAFVPYVRGGFGLYRVSIDSGRAGVPGFYRRRLAADASGRRATFTDPAFVAGTGFDVYLARQVAIGPAADVLVIRRGGRSHVVAALAMSVAYHFEEHLITPGRSR